LGKLKTEGTEGGSKEAEGNTKKRIENRSPQKFSGKEYQDRERWNLKRAREKEKCTVKPFLCRVKNQRGNEVKS